MVANIPYYESLALQEYAYALGPARPRPGGVPGWVPLSATEENGGLVVVTDGKEYYRRGGTGRLVKAQCFHRQHLGVGEQAGQVQMAAIAHSILPTAFALPIVQQLEVFAEAEYIAGANVPIASSIVRGGLGYLGRWLMFSTPLTDLLAGTTPYPTPLMLPILLTILIYLSVLPIPRCCNRFGPASQVRTWNRCWPCKRSTTISMQDPSGNQVILPNLEGVLRNGALLDSRLSQ